MSYVIYLHVYTCIHMYRSPTDCGHVELDFDPKFFQKLIFQRLLCSHPACSIQIPYLCSPDVCACVCVCVRVCVCVFVCSCLCWSAVAQHWLAPKRCLRWPQMVTLISFVLQAPQRLAYHPMGLGQTWVPLQGLK